MTDNAKNIPCDILINPTDSKYDEAIRQFQGCPTVATTKGGRIFLGWYSGGTGEPHMDNYNLLIYSDDGGKTWCETYKSDINNPSSRFYIGRTPSGNVILVNNDDSKKRQNMTVYLSDDDGNSWKYKKIIDKRDSTSYPDVDFIGDKIYLAYDFERVGAKEIYFSEFTEEDIMNPDTELKPTIISKPNNC